MGIDWADLFGFDLANIGVGEIVFRLVMAIIAGGIIGLDREYKNKPAGLRAFVIVTLGTAAYAIASLEMAAAYQGDSDTSVDPSRHIQGILGAFGFLGAGAIIQSRGSLAGIATGAAIFNAGAIGTAIGFGIVWLGILVAILSALVLITVEWYLKAHPDLEAPPEGEELSRFRDDD